MSSLASRGSALSARRAFVATAQILSLLVERSLIFSHGVTLEDMKEQSIVETLAALNQNRSNTARRLEISRRPPYDRLRMTRRAAERK